MSAKRFEGFTARQMVRGQANLLKLAALVAANGDYHQRYYVNVCGTPACAAGTWAHAHPKRYTLVRPQPLLPDHPGELIPRTGPWGQYGINPLDFALNHSRELFGQSGCGDAGDDEAKAAAYIRAFHARRAARFRRWLKREGVQS